MGILVREFSRLYEAYRKSEESPLEELRIQYADFAVWQREWLRGEVLEKQLGYWRKQLEGIETLELPTDYSRPAVASHRGGRVGLELSQDLTEKLRELSRGEGATLFMTLLGGWQVLLGRYTGQRDIAVGTAIANRNRAETEELIGFFVNTLVLRSEVKREESFRELLKQVRQRVLEAYANQDVPFEKLVEELQPERERGRTPLFRAFLVLQNAGTERLELAGLRLQGMEGERKEARFDLRMLIEEEGGGRRGGLRGVVGYADDLFERSRMERMAEHWKRLLEALVREPEKRMGELGLLSAGEREQQLVDWNQ